MIRPATPTDAPFIAQLIILAMGADLAGKFANNNNATIYTALFERFAGITNNLYSYENVLIWEESGAVCGMIISYDGESFVKLREPFLDYTRRELGFIGTPEDETQSGELYIDCLAVFPQYQGRGIAAQLIKALSAKANKMEHHTIGLLVSKDNDKAQRLYNKLGFKIVGEKPLLGGRHYRLQHVV